MALRWLNPCRLMCKNAQSVLGMACLLAWFVPIESWAQGSLWDDVKSRAGQVVRDKIKAEPTTVSTQSPSTRPGPQTTSQPVATPKDGVPLQTPQPAQGIGNGLLKGKPCLVQSAARTMKITNPSCEQLWVYQVFRTESIGFMLSMGKVMEAGIESRLNEQTVVTNFIEAVSVFSASKDLFDDTSRSLNASIRVNPKVGVKLTKAAQDSFIAWNLEMPGLLALVAESGRPAFTEANTYIFGKEAWNFMADSIAVGMDPASVPKVLTKKWAQLMVDEWALVTTEDLRVKFDSQLLAQRYLLAYYQYGQDEGSLKRSLGLSAKAPIKEALTKLARDQLGFKTGLMQIPIHWPINMSRDVDLVYTWDLVKKLDSALVQPRAKFCIEAPQYCGMRSPTPGQDTTPMSGTDATRVVDNTTSGLSGDEVAKALDPTKEHDRANAIAKMAKQGAIRSPLTADELAAILKGTTGRNRSYAIAQLSALINPHLTAPEAATVLGSVNELREQNRAAAIRSLARTIVPGSWGTEASEPLNGCTGRNRSYAIAQLASRLRPNLTGMEVSTILGQSEALSEQNRAAAIRSLVVAGRLRLPFSGDELSLVLTGTTGRNRSYAIGLLTNRP